MAYEEKRENVRNGALVYMEQKIRKERLALLDSIKTLTGREDIGTEIFEYGTGIEGILQCGGFTDDESEILLAAVELGKRMEIVPCREAI